MKHLFVALFLLTGCKTQGASEAKAWGLDGNEGAAHKFIVDTVAKYYSVKSANPAMADLSGNSAVSDFATALQNAKTEQTESSDYVLEGYQKRSQNQAAADEPTAIENYILGEFVTHTNYLEVVDNPAIGLQTVNLPATMGNQ